MLTCRICDAQNLVPNPSFEDTVLCPYQGWFEINLADGWSSYRESPDLWHTCSGYVPNIVSWQSFQYPASGNAYAGFICGNSTGVWREIIGRQLTTPLIIGVKYFVSFKVNQTSCWSASINKIGVQFSNIAYSYASPVPINNIAQVFSNSVISDTASWVTVCGSFIADSAYQYIMIGNFFTPGNFTFIPSTCGTVDEADYFLDDVCVSTDSSFTCNYSFTGIEDVIPSTLLLISPNPFNNELKIQYNTNEQMEIILYDIASRKLLQQKFTNLISINTHQLAKGIYLYEVKNRSGVIAKGKVVKD